MDDLFVEVDYIKAHFPEIVTELAPKAAIGLGVLEAVLLLIRFMLRNYETGAQVRVREGITVVCVVVLVLILLILGIDLYYYMISVKND